MFRPIAVLVLAVPAMACLGPRPWWEKELRTWEGATLSEVMEAWGAPDRTVTDEAGRPTLVYESTTTVDRRDDALLDPSRALSMDIPERALDPVQDLDCSMYLEFDNDAVVATRYEGAGCQVVPRGKKTAR
jgi:hypothetical protein